MGEYSDPPEVRRKIRDVLTAAFAAAAEAGDEYSKPTVSDQKALQENGGDAEAAAKWLREKGLAKSAAREDRDNSQGTVAVSLVDGVLYLINDDDFGIGGERTKLAAIKGLPLSQ